VGFLLIVEQMPNRIRMPGDVTLHLRVPELGAVPATNTVGRARSLLGTPRGPEDKSVLTEAFRIVGASIIALGKSRTAPQVLVVTSPLPGEGKTTVTTNLGIALAQMGCSVLLIDADMRRPRLHQTFRVVNSWGLSDVLSERNDVLQLPLDVLVKPTDVDNLFLLPSGPPVENIARLLYSQRLRQLLERFSKTVRLRSRGLSSIVAICGCAKSSGKARTVRCRLSAPTTPKERRPCKLCSNL
jgi:receptor protein-tyrosine kinase